VIPETTRSTKKAIDVTNLLSEDRVLGLLSRATNALSFTILSPISSTRSWMPFSIRSGQRAAIMLLEGQPPAPTLKATPHALRQRDHDCQPRHRPAGAQRLAWPSYCVTCSTIPRCAIRASLRADAIRSVMCAPLWSSLNPGDHGHLLGLVYLDSQSDVPPLTYRDLQVLDRFGQCSRPQDRERAPLGRKPAEAALEEDLRLAAEIQSDLLPRNSPEIPGYDVDGTTEPCRMVGGDYFDFEYDGEYLHLALADVSGKASARPADGGSAGHRACPLARRLAARGHCPYQRTFHYDGSVRQVRDLLRGAAGVAHRLSDLRQRRAKQPLLIQPDGQWQSLGVGGTVIGAFAETSYQPRHGGAGAGRPSARVLGRHQRILADADEADRQLVAISQLRGRDTAAAALRADVFHAVDQVSGFKVNDDRTLLVIQRLANMTS